MPTIRIQDWTKEKLDEVRSQESHSSYDSIIKALLRDHKLAKVAVDSIDEDSMDATITDSGPTDKSFDDLTALSELRSADNGILFLWCPNCGNEITHIVTENPISISVFEIKCQQCFTRLNQHSIVVVELNYPAEEKIIQNELQSDLRSCLIDYWDRTLREIRNGTINEELDAEEIIWQFYRYYREFTWNWPEEIPVVGIQEGETYYDRSTDMYLEVTELLSDDHKSVSSVQVHKWAEDESRTDSTTEILDEHEVRALLVDRVLHIHH